MSAYLMTDTEVSSISFDGAWVNDRSGVPNARIMLGAGRLVLTDAESVDALIAAAMQARDELKRLAESGGS